MTRAALALAAVLAVAADAPPADLSYTPPPAPPPPDPAGLVTRLAVVTGGTLALCGGVLCLARRAKAGGAAADPAGVFRHLGRLPVGPRAAVHLVEADGHTVAVAVDASGLRSVTVLSEPFEPPPGEPGA